MSRARIIRLMPAASLLLLSGCVTARLHSEAELSVVGRDCGVALGELFQDESEKRLLFLMRIERKLEEHLRAAKRQLACLNGE